jgi:E3 ubiquitin-protein ligase EDD1
LTEVCRLCIVLGFLIVKVTNLFLQRTNLDVNLAVNNLLSRDDEEGDDADDAPDSYVPEDLISLLDGGFHSEHSVIIDADAMFSEDMFGYSAMRR